FAGSAGGTRGAVGAADPGAASVGPEGGQATGRPAAPAVSLSAALAQLGQPTAAHLAFVQGLLAGIPAAVRSAAHDVEGARALLIRLLLARDADVLARQRAVLRERETERMIARVDALGGPAGSLDPYARLPVLEIAIGTLSEMPEEEYRAFRRTLEALAAADGSLEAFEWVVVSLVLRHLDPDFSAHKRK